MYRMILLMALVGITSTIPAKAQCVADAYPVTIKCQTQTCTGSIDNLLPYGYGLAAIVQKTATCCGRAYWVNAAGGQCLIASLRTQKSQRILAHLSEQNQILVADCRGWFVPLRSAHDSALPESQFEKRLSKLSKN